MSAKRWYRNYCYPIDRLRIAWAVCGTCSERINASDENRSGRSAQITGIPILIRVEPITIVKLDLSTVVHIPIGEVDAFVSPMSPFDAKPC